MFDIGFPRDWSSLKKLIWLKAAISGGGASAVWKTVTGTLIHLTDALASPMQKCEVTLEPIQDLHGQDAPYPAGGGKNLINPTKREETSSTVARWYYSDGFLLKSGQAYTLSSTEATGCAVYITKKSDDSTLRYGEPSCTYTPSEDVEVYFRVYKSGSISGVEAQLELGSTATSYAPYSNICPITGWTGCEVWNDPKYGGLINWNQIIQNGDFASVTGWEFIGNTHSVSDGVLSITGTEELNVVYKAIQFTANHKYIFKESIKASSAHNYQITLGSSVSLATLEATTVWSDKYIKFTYDSTSINLNIYRGTSGNTVQIKNVFLIDLTEMFGAGNEPSTVEEFKALFPKDYYAYNAGAETTVSAVNGDPYQHLSVTFPDTVGTVYGGTVDLVSGVLVVDRYFKTLTGAEGYGWAGSFWADKWASSAGAVPNGTASPIAVCSHFPCGATAEFGVAAAKDTRVGIPKKPDLYTDTASVNAWLATQYANGTPVQFAAAITPITYQLTPQEISTLAGENNVWSNSNGDTTIIYKAQAE